MSFVAEPYFEVAEQLLTGLTGGVARETFRFYPLANGFRFEHEDVDAETVRAIGQANGAFVAFVPGVDFIVSASGELVFAAAEDDPSVPAQGATWPDEATELYVSYYRAGAEPLITDRNVGSVTRTLGEAFAREAAVLRKQLQLVYDSAFIDTAEGADLDRVVALLAIARKRRGYAVGKVRFFRDTPAPADIFIPEDTRVSTALDPPAAFVTTVAKVLRRGQLAVEAEIRAAVPGAEGVVAAKTITVIDRSILGIGGVDNAAPTVLGGAGENDAELRARAKKALERAGRATPRAIVHALTEATALKENDVRIVEELALRPGVVQVFVARDPAAELAAKVEQAILGTRAAGIRVEHNLAVALPFEPAEALPVIDARDEGEEEAAAPAESFQLPVACDATLFAENPRVAGAEKAAIESAVKAALAAYVDASAIGGVLVYNRMVADVMTIPGVLDVILLVTPKAGTAAPGKRNLHVPEGRRAVVADADITVRFAGAPVHFDFSLALTLKVPATLAEAQAQIKARLTEIFATRPTQIASASLMSVLGVSDLYTLNAADLAWSAEYEEAGLVIREEGGAAAATALGDGDRALLRAVRAREKQA